MLDLGAHRPRWPAWLAVGAVRFDRADLARRAEAASETARWLLGRGAPERLEALRGKGAAPELASRAYAESGYYLLQTGAVRRRG